MSNVLEILNSVMIDINGKDMMLWVLEANKEYSVKSFYKLVYTSYGQSGAVESLVWRGLAPNKIGWFSWLTLQNIIATKDLLRRCGILPQDADVMCPFCNVHLETVGHVLLHCHFAWNVWSVCLRWWGTSWICPPDVSHIALWWFDSRDEEVQLWNTIFCDSMEFVVMQKQFGVQ